MPLSLSDLGEQVGPISIYEYYGHSHQDQHVLAAAHSQAPEEERNSPSDQADETDNDDADTDRDVRATGKYLEPKLVVCIV